MKNLRNKRKMAMGFMHLNHNEHGKYLFCSRPFHPWLAYLFYWISCFFGGWMGQKAQDKRDQLFTGRIQIGHCYKLLVYVLGTTPLTDRDQIVGRGGILSENIIKMCIEERRTRKDQTEHPPKGYATCLSHEWSKRIKEIIGCLHTTPNSTILPRYENVHAGTFEKRQKYEISDIVKWHYDRADEHIVNVGLPFIQPIQL